MKIKIHVYDKQVVVVMTMDIKPISPDNLRPTHNFFFPLGILTSQ